MKTNPPPEVMPEKAEQKFASTLEWLIFRIDGYLKMNKGLTPAAFGWAAIKDTGLVKRLRDGGDVTTRKFDAIVRFMSNPKGKESTHGKQIESQKVSTKKGK